MDALPLRPGEDGHQRLPELPRHAGAQDAAAAQRRHQPAAGVVDVGMGYVVQHAGVGERVDALQEFAMAGVEERLNWLRRPIVGWWIVWVFSYVVSIFSIVTSFAQDAQGIADNTVTTIVAYLLTMATLLLAMKVFAGFERQPVERPTKRWVIVRDDEKHQAEVVAVESKGQDPAA